MREISHLVTEEEDGKTVRSLALKALKLSRSQFSSLKFRSALLADGVPVHADVRLRAGQTLTAMLPDPQGNAFRPQETEDVPFSILYEDEDYFILEKPAPLPTLRSAHQRGPTLEDALWLRLGRPEHFIFRPVNRLDKGTSGLLAAAKNAHAQQLVQKQLHTDAFVREYLAICVGAPPDAAGTISLSIGKTGEGVKRAVLPDGKPAVTHYQVEKAGDARSLVRLRLETGRTHQIRVHLEALGCPVLGDFLYGSPDAELPGRFALHACSLRFRHPLSGEEISRSSPLPPELARLVNDL